LPAPEAPTRATKAPGGISTDTSRSTGAPCGAVAEAHPLEGDPPAQAPRRRRPAGLLLAGHVEHVVDPVEVAAQELELKGGLNELGERLEEAHRQGVDREHHAEAELPFQHAPGAEHQHQQRRAEGERAQGGVDPRREPAAHQRGVEHAGEQVRPVSQGARLGADRLVGLDPGEELHLVGVGVRLGLERGGHEVPVAAPVEQEQGDARHPQAEHDQPEPPVRHQDQHQVGQHQGAVEHPGEGAGGEGLPHGGVAIEPHQEVAHRARLEEGERQGEQVLQEIGRHLRVDHGAQVQEQVRADQRGDEVEPDDGGQPRAGHRQQPVGRLRHDAVHQQGEEHRDRQRQQPDQDRGGQDAPEQARAGDLPQVAPHAGRPGLRLSRLEALALFEQQGDPGEAAVELLAGDPPPAEGRVEDPRAPLAVQPVEHHEVGEPPVQDRPAGEQTEAAELVDPHAPAAQAEAGGPLQHRGGGRAVPVDAHRLAHLLQAQPPAVPGEDHGQAGRAAVRLGRLLEVGDRPPARPSQGCEKSEHLVPPRSTPRRAGRAARGTGR
jgi:hypothetical protein